MLSDCSNCRVHPKSHQLTHVMSADPVRTSVCCGHGWSLSNPCCIRVTAFHSMPMLRRGPRTEALIVPPVYFAVPLTIFVLVRLVTTPQVPPGHCMSVRLVSTLLTTRSCAGTLRLCSMVSEAYRRFQSSSFRG